MARLAGSILLILAILVAPTTSAIDDPAGDATKRFGGPPVDAPAIDIRNVTSSLDQGTLVLGLETWGALLIGPQAPAQNDSRLYTYLFIVALDASQDTNLYDHVSAGKPSITAVCTYREGLLDLACELTQGNGTLRSAGADGRNLSAVFAIDFQGPIAVGGSSHYSTPNGTGREIQAQDFTDNVLPYQGLPTGGEASPQGPDTPADAPWWRTPWAMLLAVGALVFVIGMLVPWEWFRPSHWTKKR